MPAAALSTIAAAVAALPSSVGPSRGPSGPLDVSADLLTTLGAVPDPRARRGVRHALVSVLAVAVCAVLGGARSFVALAEWGADLPAGARSRLGLGRRVISESTIRRVLGSLDADVLSTVLCGWVAARVRAPEQGPRQIAVDGKTARGARRGDERAVHLLGAIDVTGGAVLGQVEVEGKHNEITAFPQLTNRIDVAGALITADAMHTQRGHVEHLRERGAHWLLIVKGNQPTLHAQVRALPWSGVPTADVSTDKGHGRIERRALKIVEVTDGLEFPHAALAIKCVRTRGRVGRPRHSETIYAITDLSWHQIAPAMIADALRAHWHIENRLHWVRDVTFAEDHSQIRTGSGPAVMAALRNLAISLHRLTGATNIAARCRHISKHPNRALNMIT